MRIIYLIQADRPSDADRQAWPALATLAPPLPSGSEQVQRAAAAAWIADPLGPAIATNSAIWLARVRAAAARDELAEDAIEIRWQQEGQPQRGRLTRYGEIDPWPPSLGEAHVDDLHDIMLVGAQRRIADRATMKGARK